MTDAPAAPATAAGPGQPAMTVPSLADLDVVAETHRADHDRLQALLGELRDAQAEVLHRHLPGIRAATQAATASRQALLSLVEAGRTLFIRPKSRVVHGIECGWRRDPPGYDYPPDEALLVAIPLLVPELETALIRTERAPNKPAIQGLPEATREALGVSRVEGQDRPYAKVATSDVDKLVAGLLSKLLAQATAAGSAADA